MKNDIYENIDRYIKNQLTDTEKQNFETALMNDAELKREVQFRQTLKKTLKWRQQIKTAHLIHTANDRKEQIDNYVKNKLTDSEKIAFEKALSEDEALQSEVLFRQNLVKTLRWKKQLKTAHKVATKQQTTPLRAIKSDLAPQVVNKEPSTSRVFSLRRVLSYAAMLIPGMAMGWLIATNQPPDKQVDSFGGSTSSEAITLYDKETSVIKLIQDPTLTIKAASKEAIQLVITEMEDSEEAYLLTDSFLEVILTKNSVKEDNLDNAVVELILEKLERPKMQIGVLKINQTHHIIPLSDEDFNKLYQ